ncbi:MAG: FAD-binding oxidoreductase [Chthoniobacterales bacterium]
MAAPLSTSGTNAGIASSLADLSAIGNAEQWRDAGPGDIVTGIQPQLVFEPANETELAAVLGNADAAGLSVIPRGGGSKNSWGNPPTRADLILSTARLNRVIEHAWADLTVSVEAGCTIGKLQQTLAQHGQHVAVDPLWPEQATIGGILSTNDSGTLRIRYGALRDLVIGTTIALPDGTLASSGGKVVKNVAGYDLPKLVTGALGTLGVITRAIFRLHPLPRNILSFTFEAQNPADANRLLLAVQDSKLAHTGLQIRSASETLPAIDIRFDGTEAGLAAQTESLRKLAGVAKETESSDKVWQARQDLFDETASLNKNTTGPIPAAIAKFSVLPTAIADTCEQVCDLARFGGVDWRAVVQGTGLGWVRLEARNPMAIHQMLQALRSELERTGGSLAVAHRPPDMPAIDAWGNCGDTLPLMLSIKEQLDPRKTLNPGRFVGGI